MMQTISISLFLIGFIPLLFDGLYTATFVDADCDITIEYCPSPLLSPDGQLLFFLPLAISVVLAVINKRNED